MRLFRLYYKTLGEHTHVRVFAGKGSTTLGKCGNLVFRNEEWAEFQKNLYRFMRPGSDIEVRCDDDDSIAQVADEIEERERDIRAAAALSEALNCGDGSYRP